MQSAISTDLVTEIVQSIFATMIGVDIVAEDVPWSPTGDRLTSSVYLEGDWNGAISFECNRKHACHIAGHFLASDPPDEVNDDVRDVIGELANMIGGNVKSAISTDVRLSLPSVIDGSNYELHVCGSGSQDRIAFRFPSGVFWITVQAKDQAARTDPAGALCGASQNLA
ncbi:MAG: chemotaxis protein CheX [Terracidiphilus sp.]